MPRNVSQGSDQLVKGGINARTADQFDPGLGLAAIRHALVDLVLGLADEGVEEVVQRIFTHGLELMGVLLLVVARLGTVVGVASARGSRTRRSLWLALEGAATRIGGGRSGDRCRARHGCMPEPLGAVGGEGLDYGLLRHDGAIESRPGGGDDLGAQGAGGRRVDEARVPRVLDAVHDGGVAVVGVRAGRLALEGGRGAVAIWAGVAAGRYDGRRLRARGNGARRGRQRPTARLAGFARGRRGVLYMVRRTRSSRSRVQEGERRHAANLTCCIFWRQRRGLRAVWRGWAVARGADDDAASEGLREGVALDMSKSTGPLPAPSLVPGC